MSTVIKVENISKQYRLGDVGTGTISHDLNKWWAMLRGKEDPTLRLGDINDRSKKGESDYVWALKDINFEVKAGEVLGIIGRNGAGKSTLLKILSKTTQPTTGSVKLKGRVASLLEVGTGFHPELSGRENIFLNGAILGMTKREIQTKFDEIVDFSGVERYIDTPVKRYSSGMYVRLAFAVAAHLEPEILIVDEVLAVGDAEFQKKCLGKMKDVSVNDGRTVLFVSHNMGAVVELCSKAVLLGNGKLKGNGETTTIINNYLNNHLSSDEFNKPTFETSITNNEAYITKVIVKTNNLITNYFNLSDSIEISILFIVKEKNAELNFALLVTDAFNQVIFNSHNTDDNFISALESLVKGEYKATFKLTPFFLKAGVYNVSVMFGTPSKLIQELNNILRFTISEELVNVAQKGYAKIRPGIIIAQGKWHLKKYE